MRSRVTHFLESNIRIIPQQHGFCNERDRLTHLLNYFNGILKAMGEDSNADVIYLDFSQAVDRVDHYVLLKKLSNIGVRGKLLTWTECFLMNRT